MINSIGFLRVNSVKVMISMVLIVISVAACRSGDSLTGTLSETEPKITITSSKPSGLEPAPDIQITGSTGEIPSEVTKPITGKERNLVVVFVKDGNVWIWTRRDGGKPLTSSGDVIAVRISPSSKMITFTRQVDDFHAELWAIDSDGANERRLVSISALDDLSYEVRDANAVAVNPGQFEWHPDAPILAFNTVQIFNGPGVAWVNDLRSVDARSGEILTILPPGSGGQFLYNSDGSQIAISTPTSISLVDADGSNRRDVLVYDAVNTYSEYRFYAQPIWSPDGDFLRVAIPPSDTLAEPRLPTTLWYIPTDGSLASRVGSISASPIFSSEPIFSPDTAYIIFLREMSDPNLNMSELHVANGDGSGDFVYLKAAQIMLESWSTDSSRFVFRSGENQESQMGGLNIISSPLTDNPTGILDVKWVDAKSFIFIRDRGGIFDLILWNMKGSSTLIYEGFISPPVYDFVK